MLNHPFWSILGVNIFFDPCDFAIPPALLGNSKATRVWSQEPARQWPPVTSEVISRHLRHLRSASSSQANSAVPGHGMLSGYDVGSVGSVWAPLMFSQATCSSHHEVKIRRKRHLWGCSVWAQLEGGMCLDGILLNTASGDIFHIIMSRFQPVTNAQITHIT